MISATRPRPLDVGLCLKSLHFDVVPSARRTIVPPNIVSSTDTAQNSNERVFCAPQLMEPRPYIMWYFQRVHDHAVRLCSGRRFESRNHYRQCGVVSGILPESYITGIYRRYFLTRLSDDASPHSDF